MLSHVARLLSSSFAVLVFLHSSVLEFDKGHTIKQLPRGKGITRALHDPELDKVYRTLLKAGKISNAVTAGLKCGCFGIGSSLHFPCNVA